MELDQFNHYYGVSGYGLTNRVFLVSKRFLGYSPYQLWSLRSRDDAIYFANTIFSFFHSVQNQTTRMLSFLEHLMNTVSQEIKASFSSFSFCYHLTHKALINYSIKVEKYILRVALKWPEIFRIGRDYFRSPLWKVLRNQKR